MPDIIHRIGIRKPAAAVYAALSSAQGVAGWWTKDTTGDGARGGTLNFSFKNPKGAVIGEMTMDVTKVDADKRVVWKVKAGPPEWIGTDVTFDLKEEDGMTIVMFGHRGWKEQVEFMAHCSMKWGVFLQSLRDFVETGKGKPSPIDVKIDNWN